MLKEAAKALYCLKLKGIDEDDVDTHSLQAGGAQALALLGYSDQQIQKMGRRRGSTFMEYIRDKLSEYTKGMTQKRVANSNL